MKCLIISVPRREAGKVSGGSERLCDRGGRMIYGLDIVVSTRLKLLCDAAAL